MAPPLLLVSDWLTGWLAGRLAGWAAGWPAGCQAGWQAVWPASGTASWFPTLAVQEDITNDGRSKGIHSNINVSTIPCITPRHHISMLYISVPRWMSG